MVVRSQSGGHGGDADVQPRDQQPDGGSGVRPLGPQLGRVRAQLARTAAPAPVAVEPGPELVGEDTTPKPVAAGAAVARVLRCATRPVTPRARAQTASPARTSRAAALTGRGTASRPLSTTWSRLATATRAGRRRASAVRLMAPPSSSVTDSQAGSSEWTLARGQAAGVDRAGCGECWA